MSGELLDVDNDDTEYKLKIPIIKHIATQPKYLVQMRSHNRNPLTYDEWLSDQGWDWIPTKVYEDKDLAIRRLREDVWLMRVITSEDELIMGYDPELDTRLPGCRWRMIQRNAYHLWEAAGRPDGMSDHFWQEAEQSLKENDGIIEF